MSLKLEIELESFREFMMISAFLNQYRSIVTSDEEREVIAQVIEQIRVQLFEEDNIDWGDYDA